MPADLQVAVRRLTVRSATDVSAILQRVTNATQAREALGEVLPAMVEQYGAAAGSISAQWYDEQRAKRRIPGKFRATPASLGTAGADALVGYGTQPLSGEVPNFAVARTLIVGGLQRRIANYSRQTVMSSSTQDPQARGWQRVGDGNSCEFCSMLLGRGAVYTEASADFQAHDHCGCTAEPAWT